MQLPERDDWLAQFLELMYRGNFTISLTLTLPGMLVSGTPIAPAEFFRLSGEEVNEAWKRNEATASVENPLSSYFTDMSAYAGELAQTSIEHQDALAEETAKEPLKLAEDDPRAAEWQSLLPRYVHLKNVQVATGNSPNIRLPLWRGRLSEVIGVNIGEFST